jgi:hypothetical protein
VAAAVASLPLLRVPPAAAAGAAGDAETASSTGSAASGGVQHAAAAPAYDVPLLARLAQELQQHCRQQQPYPATLHQQQQHQHQFTPYALPLPLGTAAPLSASPPSAPGAWPGLESRRNSLSLLDVLASSRRNSVAAPGSRRGSLSALLREDAAGAPWLAGGDPGARIYGLEDR